MNDRPAATLRDRAMSPLQIMSVCLCVAMNMLDGFDILVMSFAAPAISREWSLLATQTGLIFSAALAGMMVGALALSWLADTYGRRNVIIGSLFLTAVGMLLSGVADSFGELLIARLLTGLGVGGLMPTLNTIVAEYCNDRRRDLAVVLQAAGYPLGGVLGGLVAIGMIDWGGWRSLMFVGSGSAVVLMLVAIGWMPESLSFLSNSGSPRNAARLTRLMARLGLERASIEPPYPVKNKGLFALWTPALRRRTALLCLTTFAVQFSFYFFISWTPSILSRAGLSTTAGISGAVWLNIGGILADLVFALVVARWGPWKLGSASMVCAFATSLVLTLVIGRHEWVFFSAMLLGGFLFASMAAIYAVAPAVFPAPARASGTGMAISVGRLGGILGPLAGAVLIGAGSLSPPAYSAILASPLIIASILLWRSRHTSVN